MNRVLFLPLLLLWVPQMLFAQNAKPSRLPEPSWATINNYDYTNASMDKQAEDGYINLLSEEQVNLKDESIYRRKAYKILSEEGVQNNSELTIQYDPSYSKLIFHSVKIIRGKETLNQLNLPKIKMIQQEKDLGRHMYDGSLSAVIFLEDVRKGDIVEYSYTIKGFNPIFKGKYSNFFETSYSIPLYNLFYKLVVPAGRTMNIKNSLINIKPEVTTDNTGTSYQWKLSNLTPLKLQDNVPSWFDLYSMIIVSEYNSWAEVSKWATELFPENTALSSGLKEKIGEISKQSVDDESKILAALRFVQDDIRYMGIEMGVKSHKPTHPNKIFSQRFGDCKDKSFLLCSMLNAMGIEAHPVLINTTYKKTINDWLPASTIFDHVTVRVKLNNKYYWFDPTISYQRGRIDDISYPDYQSGLVITDTSTTLSKIPFHDKGMTKVKEVFDIPDTYGRAKLTVISNYSGSFADDVRRSLDRNSIEEVEETGRKFYSNYFDKIEVDSVNYSDNVSTGVLTVKEYYSIKDLWEVSKGRKKVAFKPYIIDGVMIKPSETDRKMPFSLSYPAKYSEVIEINLPEDWRGEQSEYNVRCKGFKLKTHYSYKYRQFKLQYDYENLKDYVEAAESDEYLEKYKKANENLAYEISLPANDDDDSFSDVTALPSTSSGITLVLVLVAVAGLVIWVAKRV